MIELFPNVYYVPGKNASRFPYCACLYLKGRDLRLLIDAGMGAGQVGPVKQMGVDVLLLSHSHIDHHLTKRELRGVPIWAHAAELPYVGSRERYLQATGIADSGVDLSALLDAVPGLFDYQVSRVLADGEVLDLGDLSLEVLHTPGHTPGHLAFYLPQHNFLFSADVDLTGFGPYYGHYFADLEDFIASIRRLKALGAARAATGHAGPFMGDVAQRLEAYEQVIYQRDQRVLDFLQRPRRLNDFRRSGVIYRTYIEDFGLQDFFERVHVEKHLHRLAALGRVRVEDGLWRLC
ncbi:MAG: MBL fold metallo-hydrolase [Desulfarculus sp.]|jgi:glyoxylase-like metal-dependent hydrolase (beta-lactamase superfamily II)|nr:MAG: MBL fold metallo-hydrolase [Desulfarculus sp.]